ncbi:MAG TPA: DPP IV N-terminal domain-containing protein, partial [Pyrinomonadaceae bacterium]
MTPADTLRVANVSEAQIAPDGSTVCYTVSTVEGNASRTSLWCAQLGDERIVPPQPRRVPQQVLGGEWNVSRPRWSPDGRRLAFVATRGEQGGIWVMSPRGERPQQPRFVVPVRSTNFHIPYAGESFAWSPDGRRIAFINATEEGQEDAAAVGLTATTVAADRARRDDPRIVDRIRYKSRTAFSDTLRTHVWLVDVDDPSTPRQLTSGQYYDHALTWNPRGDEIAFLSNHETDPEAVNNSDIFAVSAGDGRVRRLTETRGCEYEPAWSPDGKLIAYTATTRDVTTIDSVAEDAHVWVIDATPAGKGRELTAAQDRRARNPRWSADGTDIFFLAGDRGATLLYRVAASGGQVSNVFLLQREPQTTPAPPAQPAQAQQQQRIQIGNFSVGRRALLTAAAAGETQASSIPASSVVALTLSEPLTPASVWVSAPPRTRTGTAIRLVAAHHTEFMRQFALSEPEELNFRSADNTR